MDAPLLAIYTVMIGETVCFWQRLHCLVVEISLADKGLADNIQVNSYIAKAT